MEDNRKMQIISQLMEELQGLMEPNADELGDRLGKPKSVDVMKISAGAPGEEGMDPLDKKLGMSDEDDDMPMDDDEPASPDEMLKRRLMNLRK